MSTGYAGRDARNIADRDSRRGSSGERGERRDRQVPFRVMGIMDTPEDEVFVSVLIHPDLARVISQLVLDAQTPNKAAQAVSHQMLNLIRDQWDEH